MKRFLAQYSPLFILGVLCAVLATFSRDFRTPDNLQNVAYRTCELGIVATGQTLVILAGGIDLSVGSVAALSGVIAAQLMTMGHVAPVWATAIGAIAGMGCGAITGLMWTKAKLPPFIASLGVMMAARGVVLLISGAKPVFGLPDAFRYLGGVKGWWIPVIIALAITAFFSTMLTFARFGRALYAVGGNAEAARLSGVRVDRVRLGAFVLCGLLTGFAGVMLASKVGIGDPSAAQGMELNAIAACVIGGASLMGGQGGCAGSLAGALIMNVLVNSCNLMNFRPQWQQVLVGGLIILLVFYDTRRKRKVGLIRD